MKVAAFVYGLGWTFEELKAAWIEVETLGYDACYISDDLFPPPYVGSDEACYDPWTLLPVFAEITNRIGLGSFVSPCGRRHPALLAKTATLVDVISRGRLTLGMGLGNFPSEHHAFGLPYPKALERVAILREEIEIIKRMWTEDRASFDGSYYRIKNGINVPKPVQRPHPPILLGFSSKKFLPRLAAEHADRINLFTGDSEAAEILDIVAGHCREIGRDFAAIGKSRIVSVSFTPEEVADLDREIERRAQRIRITPDFLRQQHENGLVAYVGPAQRCSEIVRRRTVGLGFDEIVVIADGLGVSSYENEMGALRTFAAEVLPDLRRS